VEHFGLKNLLFELGHKRAYNENWVLIRIILSNDLSYDLV
jgi:hypothetical protein